MDINLKLKNGQIACGDLKKLKYHRKENGLYEVAIYNFYTKDDKGNQVECYLKLDNASINTDEESGCIYIEPFMEMSIDYDDNYMFQIVEKDSSK